MSRVQQLVLAVGLFALLIAAAFPPWRYVGAHTPTNIYDVSAGHGFLLAPPAESYLEGGRVPPGRMRVDAGFLLAELATIMSITGLILTGLGYSRRHQSSP